MLPFPGLLTAAGIFAVYLVAEGVFKHLTYDPRTGTVYKFKKTVTPRPHRLLLLDTMRQAIGEMPELKRQH